MISRSALEKHDATWEVDPICARWQADDASSASSSSFASLSFLHSLYIGYVGLADWWVSIVQKVYSTHMPRTVRTPDKCSIQNLRKFAQVLRRYPTTH